MSELWVVWLQNLGLVLLGLFVGVMAWRGSAYWQLFAFGMAILYLAIVISSPLSSERTVPDSLLLFDTDIGLVRALQLKLRLVEAAISKGLVIRPARMIYSDFLMPVFQIAVLVWIARLHFTRKPSVR